MNLKTFVTNCVPLIIQLVNIAIGVLATVSSLVAVINSDFTNILGEFSDVLLLNSQLKLYVRLQWIVFNLGILIIMIAVLQSTLQICKKKRFWKWTFILLGILMAFELSLGIFMVMTRQEIENMVQFRVTAAFDEASQTTDMKLLALLNEMQSQFNCCGLAGFSKNDEIPCLASWKKPLGCADAIWAAISDDFSQSGGISMFISFGLDILYLLFVCSGKRYEPEYSGEDHLEMLPIMGNDP